MSRFESLFRKSLENTSTEAERQELMQLIARSQHDGELLQLLDEVIAGSGDERALPDQRAKEILALIVQAGGQPQVRGRAVRMRWWAAAASLLLLAGAAGYLLRRPSVPVTATLTPQTMEEIRPASQSAILTLDDGSQVMLDSLHQGSIRNAAGAAIHLGENTLAYSGSKAGAAAYNTLSTPRGKLFHLVLPDGTEVWLNAASSLRYPVSFNAAERTVELNGEAYFEVKQAATRPFRVKTGPQGEVRVLGTGFNVNAYTNEPAVTTTLLHGSVQVVAAERPTLLKPGQQAAVTGADVKIQTADTSQVTAWKEGLFQFDNAGIQQVMNQLERWYDITVVYEKGVPDIRFGGKMERDLDLRSVLRILEISNVHYRLEERKLIITQ
ncbi:FecR domain-containing protein [Chitinophaga oryzae]|uniref:FecR domain-containing protein n=1 Tax=Chitinophaga oryzae TaxID=2725414 RepID=A0ABX6LME8_9BACT|nr:FecR family protein [Chitinophaga oryzae]QJB39999.1 FecR domain-containing protein [Chitinophaga oryzae]